MEQILVCGFQRFASTYFGSCLQLGLFTAPLLSPIFSLILEFDGERIVQNYFRLYPIWQIMKIFPQPIPTFFYNPSHLLDFNLQDSKFFDSSVTPDVGKVFSIDSTLKTLFSRIISLTHSPIAWLLRTDFWESLFLASQSIFTPICSSTFESREILENTVLVIRDTWPALKLYTRYNLFR